VLALNCNERHFAQTVARKPRFIQVSAWSFGSRQNPARRLRWNRVLWCLVPRKSRPRGFMATILQTVGYADMDLTRSPAIHSIVGATEMLMLMPKLSLIPNAFWFTAFSTAFFHASFDIIVHWHQQRDWMKID
jgi:hypothetical protein